MSLQDPVSDMITCIRNGQFANKIFVLFYFSKIKQMILKLLQKEGYIKYYKVIGFQKKKIKVFLKYYQGKGVIDKITRISKPSLRVYKKYNDIPKVLNGLGIVIISTSKGILTDKLARKLKVGGEIICYVS
ncbi:30S ribosomal protein S8 [Buchnera aphidicola (Taiwanaphis decaspermi)]|uniref:30S ribosomal protein S8 n=1 Tax=Buchnera aphidicola TaxID=9 RepID=UPI0031B7F145